MRNRFLQQLQPLAGDPFGHFQRQSGHVAARSRQADCEPGRDRVAHRRDHNLDGAGRFAGGNCGGRAGGYEYIDLLCDDVGHERRQSIDPAFRRATLDDHILALDPSQLAQALPKLLHRKRHAGGPRRVHVGYAHNSFCGVRGDRETQPGDGG